MKIHAVRDILGTPMKQKFKEWLEYQARQLFKCLGYSLRNRSEPGGDPLIDMKRLMDDRAPLVFDVGSNTGQTIDEVRAYFPEFSLHGFEPSPQTFAPLKEKYSATPGVVKLNNFGLGARHEVKEFIENSKSDMSSFLEPDRDCWGEIAARIPVQIETLDDYASLNFVSYIDILKIDTQG